MLQTRLFTSVLLLAGLGSGCGYTLQTSQSPLTEKEGIRKIYVEPLTNTTYSPGVENLVYNALVKGISVHRRVDLVNSRDQADAVLTGKVLIAQYAAGPETPAQSLSTNGGLNPVDQRANILIATEYEVTLSCSFQLARPHPAPGQKAIVWTSAFNRTKPFEGNNQLGVQGDTSALINESEYQRALGDLATAMMGDLQESMLAMF